MRRAPGCTRVEGRSEGQPRLQAVDRLLVEANREVDHRAVAQAVRLHRAVTLQEAAVDVAPAQTVPGRSASASLNTASPDRLKRSMEASGRPETTTVPLISLRGGVQVVEKFGSASDVDSE